MRTKILEYLNKTLPKRRLYHTLGVEKYAIRLARIYNLNETKASVAALLHDVAKPYNTEDMLALAGKYGLVFDEYELSQPTLMHGPLAAAMAKRLFRLRDKGVLAAIEYHTTGRKDMTLIEKIIYLADLAESSRSFEGIDQIRRLCEIDINQAMITALKNEIMHLLECNMIVHPRSVEALNQLMMEATAEEKAKEKKE